MVKGLYTAYTGMVQEQRRMDVITNNLANFNTTGYKKEGLTSQAFDEQLALKIKDYTDAPLTARRIGYITPGVKIGQGYTDWSEGPMRETNNTYDLAIAGDGFFTIEYTNKAVNIERDVANVTTTMYTRDGNFTLTTDGVLTTQDGDFVLSNAGAHITLDPNLETQINTSGEIIQDGEVVATLGIADFEDYDYLEHYGENYWYTIDGYTEKDFEGQVYAGFLEQSNVSVVDEMVNMIAVQRNYETNQKMITTIDDTLQTAVTQVGILS